MMLVLATAIFLVLNREFAAKSVTALMTGITGNFGWLFVITGFAAFVFALWLAFGRYAHVRLDSAEAGREDNPE